EVGCVVSEEPYDHLARLLEAVAALPRRPELDPVGPRFLLVPAGADPELEPPSRDDVEGGGHVGEHGWMAVLDAGHQYPEAQPAGGLGQRRQRCPTLKARTVGVTADR